MHELFADFRYALRTLAKSRALTSVIVLSLALGIGANSAIFSGANALFLKPLPYSGPSRLTVLWLRSPGIGIPQDWPSPGQYIDILTQYHTRDRPSPARNRLSPARDLLLTHPRPPLTRPQPPLARDRPSPARDLLLTHPRPPLTRRRPPLTRRRPPPHPPATAPHPRATASRPRPPLTRPRPPLTHPRPPLTRPRPPLAEPARPHRAAAARSGVSDPPDCLNPSGRRHAQPRSISR